MLIDQKIKMKKKTNLDNELLLNFSEMAKIFFELYIFKKKLSSEEKGNKKKNKYSQINAI